MNNENKEARLTGLDAGGQVISTEEYAIIATRALTPLEEKIIRKHILEKLYAYENSDDEFCKSITHH